MALLLSVLALLTLTACGSNGQAVEGITTGDNHGYTGAYLDQPYVAAPVPLETTQGGPVDLAKAPDLNVVFFGYTNCPDICQAVMATIASAYVRLDKGEKARTHVYFVSTDPARDTVQEMTPYLSRFDPSFVGARASLADTVKVASSLKIFLEKGTKLASGGYEVTHTTSVLALTGGRARLVWSQDTSPKAMAEDIQRLLKATT